MTTAYSFDQSVWRERKRPALTSTNAYIVWPVFGDAVKKWLEIPLVIDEYNHGMNSVDQVSMEMHRKRHMVNLWSELSLSF
jgi:hypothetical protein